MDSREQFFVNNYSFFGASSIKRCGYNKKEAQAIKDKYKKKGVYMLPVRKTAKEKMPAKKGKKQTTDTFSTIGFAVACLDYDDQNQIIELSKQIPDCPILIDETIALQLSRIARGYQAEQERGMLLDTTESAIQNYVNMIQVKKVINDGQEVNVNFNTLSSVIDEIEKEENGLDFDYDKEAKKQELKTLRKQGITDIIDELDEE